MWEVILCLTTSLFGFWGLVKFIFPRLATLAVPDFPLPVTRHFTTVHNANCSVILENTSCPFQTLIKNLSYTGLKLEVKSEVDCWVVPLWGVPALPFMQLLHKDYDSLYYYLIDASDEENFSRICVANSPRFFLSSGEERCLKIEPLVNLDPLTMCNAGYTFVAMMLTAKKSDICMENEVLLSTVAHIKYPEENQIVIRKLVKSFNGSVSLVRTSYTASSGSVVVNGKTYEGCCVCYERPITIGIIPCYHVCTCYQCYVNCDRCPICRGRSEFFFRLKDSEHLDNLPHETFNDTDSSE